MGLQFVGNAASLSARTNLNRITRSLNLSIERLSSGFRINRGSDDAAGLAISERLRAQIRGSQAALGNVQDGISVLNTADGSLTGIQENVQRMRELAVSAANDTLSSANRSAIQAEIDQLAADITRLSDSASFNGKNLLDGSLSGAGLFVIQAGPNSGATANSIDVGATGALADTDATVLAINSLSVSTATAAGSAITALDGALSQIGTQIAKVGAVSNRLQSAANNLQVSIENTAAAESRIRNVDVAQESSRYVQLQILQQAATALLFQANQSPTVAFRLLNSS